MFSHASIYLTEPVWTDRGECVQSLMDHGNRHLNFLAPLGFAPKPPTMLLLNKPSYAIHPLSHVCHHTFYMCSIVCDLA
jgi:hypothetical protein